MTEEGAARREIMGNYYRKTDRDEVTQGFLPHNPIPFNIKETVLKELRENKFGG
ncbi:hypothetical protein A2U01_0055201, partial [Trifolium medium]|nr:hypothetical protein [Trifolium medium]